MKISVEKPDFSVYLANSQLVDFTDKTIQQQTEELIKDISDETEIVKKLFRFVRDEISHSADINGIIVTKTASEVLEHRQGICYAKSLLLAAMLRYQKIPAGFCYQSLILDDETAPVIILHALNAVYLKSLDRWIRLDARGNKPGIDAQFSISKEKLAFSIRPELGEIDHPVIFAEPNKNTVAALYRYNTAQELMENLPGVL